MRARSCLSCGLLAILPLVTSCGKGPDTELGPSVALAYTRFVHAVADTSATDWRFIDQLENSPVAFGLVFRGSTPYQATATGARHLRVFPTTTDINVAPNFLIDTVLTFEPDTYYTIVHLGFTRAGQTPADRVLLLKDNLPTVASEKASVRLVHLGTGLGNVDVFADTLGGTSPLPATPIFTNIASATASNYLERDTARLVLRVANAGQTAVVATGVAPAGEAGNPTLNLTPIGGSRMGKSVMSAFFFPRSVANSPAPASFTTPGIVYLIDRHPK